MHFNEFIGQEPIKRELINCAGQHVHILLRGASGCGKTELAEMTAALRGDYDLVTARNVTESSFNPLAVTHIVDEVHLITQPELLFNLMQTVPFIFCTTEGGELAETLTNRCIQLTLQPYSHEEMCQIGQQKYAFSFDVLELLSDRARETPRVMLTLCQRVQINLPADPPYVMVKQFLTDVGVFEHGYTTNDVRYLSTLAQVGRASATTLAAMLNVPLSTVVNEIEPFLLRRGDILITGRGRMLRINDQ
jgi:Holliday junction resolvasome RuvABC ATP-dependent DNA helicase subunit